MDAVKPAQTLFPLTLWVAGKPAPQGSKNVSRSGHVYETSKALKPWRERIALGARAVMTGPPLFGLPLYVDLEFVMPRPKSTPRRSTPAAIKRPDVDKLVRAVLDGLTGVVFADDSAVVTLKACKRLADVDEETGVGILVAVKR